VGAEIDTSKAYMIQNVNSGKYLDVERELAAAGTNVDQWQGDTWNRKDNQTWYVKEVNWGYYYIYSALGDGNTYLLHVPDGNDGSNITIDTRNKQSNQYFKFVKNQDGTYEIVTRASRERSCVEIAYGSSDNGANVQQYQWNNHNCQKWRLIVVGERENQSNTPTPTVKPTPTTKPSPTQGQNRRKIRYRNLDLDGNSHIFGW
jgi:hypothetical protein